MFVVGGFIFFRRGCVRLLASELNAADDDGGDDDDCDDDKRPGVKNDECGHRGIDAPVYDSIGRLSAMLAFRQTDRKEGGAQTVCADRFLSLFSFFFFLVLCARASLPGCMSFVNLRQCSTKPFEMTVLVLKRIPTIRNCNFKGYFDADLLDESQAARCSLYVMLRNPRIVPWTSAQGGCTAAVLILFVFCQLQLNKMQIFQY